ncbi:DUF4304 domain-containing protein [Halomonas sp. ISL-106]|nr:DUF4304 domain-containing protein [Halomonas sp. ISL-106]MBT2798613.1 DUF4304 domain-containing protein [Halomonas sp. ISL-104]
MKMINIQASQFNNSSEWSFTINVGVYFPAIVEITGGSPVNGMPKEYNCTTRE